MVTGLGWYLTKHAAGIYSGREPEHPWNRKSLKAIQPELNAMISPALCEKPQGKVTIETYTVLHDLIQEGPHAVIVGRLDSGERCLATSGKDFDLAYRMEQEEFLGRRGEVRPGPNGTNIFQVC